MEEMPRHKRNKGDSETKGNKRKLGSSFLVVLGLSVGLLARLAGNDLLAVLVELEAGDDDVRGVDAEGDGGTVGLLAVDALHVDDPLLAGDLGDLALRALGRATDDQDLVILADGERSDLFRVKKQCAKRKRLGIILKNKGPVGNRIHHPTTLWSISAEPSGRRAL